MSSIHSRNFFDVIVRAYGDQPVRLKGRNSGGQLEVHRDDPQQSMGWPLQWAYQDDRGTFETLEAAWKSGDQKALQAAWSGAKPITLS